MSKLLQSPSQRTADRPGEDDPGGRAGIAEVPLRCTCGIAAVPVGQPTAYPGSARTPTKLCVVDHQHAKTGESH